MLVECRDNLFTKMVYKNPKFDLNKNPVVVCCNDEFDEDNQCDDTALRLECSGHGSISSASSRQQDVKAAPNGGSGLVLGLGPTPSANERDLVLRLGFSHCSDTSKGDLNTVCNDQSASVEVSNGFGFGFDHVVDEGSTSAKSSGGYMPSLLLAPRINVPRRKVQAFEPEPSVVAGFLSETSSDHQTSGKKGVFEGSRAQETQENKKVFLGIRPRLFHGLVSRPGPNISPDNHSFSGSSGVSNSTSWLQKPAKRRQLIPPQVLVPSSMKSSSSVSVSPFTKQSSSETSNTGGPRSFGLVAPEGRVHGGSLSPLVNGNLRDAVIDGI